jgi:hypothetical protein
VERFVDMINTRTGKLTDIKEITEADIQKRVNIVVKAYVDAEGLNIWYMSDEAHTIFLVNKYIPEQIRRIYREAFCKANGIPQGEKWGKDFVKNPEYHAFTQLVGRIVRVACIDDKLYQEFRKSGRSHFSVWAELTTSKKRMKQIEDKADKEIAKLNMKQQLEKDVAEGVGNAAELLEGHLKNEKYNPKLKVVSKEESKGWTAPLINEDLKWVQDCRKICRQSPELFVRMVKSCMDNGYLSEMSYRSIKEDLKQ